MVSRESVIALVVSLLQAAFREEIFGQFIFISSELNSIKTGKKPQNQIRTKKLFGIQQMCNLSERAHRRIHNVETKVMLQKRFY